MTHESAHPRNDQLVAFGLGKLDLSEATAIAEHLDHCRECSETIVGLKDDTFVGFVRQSPASLRLHSESNDAPHVASQGNHPLATIDVDSGAMAPEHQPLELPPELREHPRYAIAESIGHGGMGDVYKAQHKLMNRAVALKVIKPELVQHEAAVQRFRREVQAAARLYSPNIVTAYDAEQAGNLHFLVMEYVEGVNLDEVVRQRGGLPVDQACDYIRQAAAGLQHAHELRMVHRDVKPHNLMLTAAGEVKILDFGLANLASEPQADDLLDARGSSSEKRCSANPQLTQSGATMGTPDYIAPEQARDAHAADIRADIYSLGCTFYTLLTGRPPFGQRTVLEKIKAHTEEEAEPLLKSRNDVPPDVERIVQKMMAKNPAERFQTPAEVVAALATCSSVTPKLAAGGKGSRRHPVRVVAMASMFLAAMAAAAIFYIQTNQGVVRVEVADQSLQVQLNGRTIEMQDGDTPLTIRVGDPKLIVRRGDFVFETDEFQLRRGDEIALKVVLLAGEIVVLKDGQRFDAERVPQVRRDLRVPTGMVQVSSFMGHTDEVRDLEFFSDGARLASSSSDKTLRIWDVKTGRELYKRDCPHFVSSLAISPDGKLAALGYVTVTPVSGIEIFDLETKQRLHNLAGPPNRVERLEFSPDGTRLLSTGSKGMGIMWTVATGEKLYDFQQGTSYVWDGTFSPDGSQILTASSGPPQQIVLRNAADGSTIRNLVSPKLSAIVTARFSADGKRIVAAAGVPEIPVYETATGKRVQTIHSPSGTDDVRFWKGNRYIIASGNDNVLRIFDAQSAKLLMEMPLKRPIGMNLALPPDETLLATGGGIAKNFVADHLKNRLGATRDDYNVQLWRLPETLP